MKPLTTAQQLLIFMGLDPVTVILVSKKSRMPSYTKSGPGRFHKQGKVTRGYAK